MTSDEDDRLVLVPLSVLAQLATELEETRSQLEERKLVDRAKGLLMKHRGLSEEEAYGALRSLAMERGIRLGEAARQVIDIAAVIAPN